MSIMVQDLTDDQPSDNGRLLYCEDCDIEYSAEKSTYFWMASDWVITCGHCGKPVALCEKQITYEVLKR